MAIDIVRQRTAIKNRDDATEKIRTLMRNSVGKDSEKELDNFHKRIREIVEERGGTLDWCLFEIMKGRDIRVNFSTSFYACSYIGWTGVRK